MDMNQKSKQPRHKWKRSGRYSTCENCGCLKKTGFIPVMYTDKNGKDHKLAPPCTPAKD